MHIYVSGETTEGASGLVYPVNGHPFGTVRFGNGAFLNGMSPADCAAVAAAATVLKGRLEAAISGTPHDFAPAPDEALICDTCGIHPSLHPEEQR